MKKHFSPVVFHSNNPNIHKCYSEREGDWVVFRCPICHDFERKLNRKTGEMKTTISPDNWNMHQGCFIPPGLDTELYHPN